MGQPCLLLWAPQCQGLLCVARVHSQWGVNPLGVARVTELIWVRACGTLWPSGRTVCAYQRIRSV
eukprot:scaffold1954_cov63-Phaeocystis_antarctica.AAC.5